MDLNKDDGYIANPMLALILKDMYINQWEHDFYLKCKKQYELSYSRNYTLSDKQMVILNRIKDEIYKWVDNKIVQPTIPVQRAI